MYMGGAHKSNLTLAGHVSVLLRLFRIHNYFLTFFFSFFLSGPNFFLSLSHCCNMILLSLYCCNFLAFSCNRSSSSSSSSNGHGREKLLSSCRKGSGWKHAVWWNKPRPSLELGLMERKQKV